MFSDNSNKNVKLMAFALWEKDGIREKLFKTKDVRNIQGPYDAFRSDFLEVEIDGQRYQGGREMVLGILKFFEEDQVFKTV